MRIEVTEAGKWTLDAPQQVWRGEDGKADSVLQSALFAGQAMLVVKESDDTVGFSLRYLGFKATGFMTMVAAKQSAPDFAQRVLGRMLNMASK